jgi:hypothetical protein
VYEPAAHLFIFLEECCTSTLSTQCVEHLRAITSQVDPWTFLSLLCDCRFRVEDDSHGCSTTVGGPGQADEDVAAISYTRVVIAKEADRVPRELYIDRRHCRERSGASRLAKLQI